LSEVVKQDAAGGLLLLSRRLAGGKDEGERDSPALVGRWGAGVAWPSGLECLIGWDRDFV
jgi:hypothetical protein